MADSVGRFAYYVANFGSYNKTYGTLGAIIALLVLLWITNVAILSAPRSTPSASEAVNYGMEPRRRARTATQGALSAQAEKAIPHRLTWSSMSVVLWELAVLRAVAFAMSTCGGAQARGRLVHWA